MSTVAKDTAPYDAVDENDELLEVQPFCQAEPSDGGTLCEKRTGHSGTHLFSRETRTDD